MSDDVLIKIRGDISKLTESFSQIQSQLKKTGEGVTGLSNTFNKLKNIAGIALIGKGLQGLVSDIFNTGKTFENEMGKVQAITQSSSKDINALTNYAKKMGKDTLASASEASQGMQYLGMAGWKTNEIMAGLPNILNLSIGAGEGLALTSDIVSDALTAFNMTAQQSGSLCDIMASASSNANTNVALLGESYKYCAPVVGALGMSAQDATIALGLMANCGIKASMGGTALRSTLTNLVKPTKKMDGALRAIGFSITDNNGKTKSLKNVMDELREKTGKMTEAEKARFASTVAGKEAMSGLLAVLNASPADYDKLTKAVYESDGACKKMADTMGNTLEGKLKGTSSKLEALKITLFDSVKEPLKQCTDALNIFLEWLNGALPSAINTVVWGLNQLKGGWDNICIAVGAVNKFFSEHQVLAGIVGTALAVVVTELMAMKIWLDSAKIAQGAYTLVMGGFNAVMGVCNGLMATFETLMLFIVSPVGLVVGAITALIAVGYLLYKNWDSVCNCAKWVWSIVVQAWNGLCADTKRLFSEIGEAISIVFSAIGDWISNKIEWICNTAVAGWNGLCAGTKAVFDAVYSAICECMQVIGDWISNKVEFICNTTVAGWNALCAGISTVWETIKAVCQVAVMLVVSIVKGIIDLALLPVQFIWINFGEAIAKVWNDINFVISQFVAQIITTLIGWGQSLWATIEPPLTAVKDFFVMTWNTIKAFCISTWDALKYAVTSTFNKVKEVITTVWTAVSTFLTQCWEGIKNYAVKTFNAIKDKIGAIWQAVSAYVIQVWTSIKAWAINCWESIKTKAIATFTAIKDKINAIWQAVSNYIMQVWTSIKNWIVSCWTAISNKATEVFNAIKAYIVGIWNSVCTTTTAIWNSIKNAIMSVWNSIYSTVSSIVNNVKSTVSSVFESIKGVCTTVWNGIKNAIISPVSSAFEKVSGIINRIKGLFNFSWSLPKLKLPHFSLSGSFSLAPPSVPKMSIDWHAKGGIFTRPTVLGSHGFGEAGKEAILPLGKLPSLIGVDKQQQLIDKLLQEGTAGGNSTIHIENFVNNREQDVEQLAKEFEFYKRRVAIGTGGYK